MSFGPEARCCGAAARPPGASFRHVRDRGLRYYARNYPGLKGFRRATFAPGRGRILALPVCFIADTVSAPANHDRTERSDAT